MYCRNCGEQLNDGQAICLKCGVAVGDGNQYCQNCGNKTSELAVVCVNCGCALKNAKEKKIVNEGNLNGKDKTTVALICFFLGGLGIHNFYMGEKKKGWMKIILSLLCGIGGILALIDFIKILMGSYQYDPDASF